MDLSLESIVQRVTDAATDLSGARFGSFFYNVTGTLGERHTLYALSGAPRAAFLKVWSTAQYCYVRPDIPRRRHYSLGRHSVRPSLW
jgi:hypothetical protein